MRRVIGQSIPQGLRRLYAFLSWSPTGADESGQINVGNSLLWRDSDHKSYYDNMMYWMPSLHPDAYQYLEKRRAEMPQEERNYRGPHLHSGLWSYLYEKERSHVAKAVKMSEQLYKHERKAKNRNAKIQRKAEERERRARLRQERRNQNAQTSEQSNLNQQHAELSGYGQSAGQPRGTVPLGTVVGYPARFRSLPHGTVVGSPAPQGRSGQPTPVGQT